MQFFRYFSTDDFSYSVSNVMILIYPSVKDRNWRIRKSPTGIGKDGVNI